MIVKFDFVYRHKLSQAQFT